VSELVPSIGDERMVTPYEVAFAIDCALPLSGPLEGGSNGNYICSEVGPR